MFPFICAVVMPLFVSSAHILLVERSAECGMLFCSLTKLLCIEVGLISSLFTRCLSAAAVCHTLSCSSRLVVSVFVTDI